MLGTALAALFAAQSPTMDLPEGTILCHDQRAAEELVAAVENDPDRLPWLMNGACSRLPVAYNDQTVLRTLGDYPKVIWSNGKWRQDRVVIPPAIAARAERLLPDPTTLTIERQG